MLLQSTILLVIGAGFMLLAVRRLRVQTLKERHALVFMITALPMFILAIWPSFLDRLVNWTGISASTIMLMGVCVFFVYMILELLSLISKLDQRVLILAQTISIQNERELANQMGTDDIDDPERQNGKKTNHELVGRSFHKNT